eukprot:1100864-Rhodomonas_salina.1
MGMGLALCRLLVQKSCRGMVRGWSGCSSCPRLISDRDVVNDVGAAKTDHHASGREEFVFGGACPPSTTGGVRDTRQDACVGDDEGWGAAHGVSVGVDGDLVCVVGEAVDGADGVKEGVESRGGGLESGAGLVLFPLSLFGGEPSRDDKGDGVVGAFCNRALHEDWRRGIREVGRGDVFEGDCRVVIRCWMGGKEWEEGVTGEAEVLRGGSVCECAV